ncbi:MAG: hypothetical protein EA349_00410, partial [Halomonadaceae bacterium]
MRKQIFYDRSIHCIITTSFYAPGVTMKTFIYGLCRHTGIFRLARYVFRKKLLILCYHGISIRDEHSWWPGVFMAEDKFIRRLQLLKQSGCHVLGLQSAVAALKAGTLPDNTVVLTADDGYLNSPQTLVKHCNRFQYPLTIYVTSYYSQNRNPIFNAMVYYMLWKTQKTVLVGEFPFADKPGQQHWDLTGSQQKLLAKQIIDYGRNHCSEEQRRELSENLSTALGLDFSLMDDEGICKLIN